MQLSQGTHVIDGPENAIEILVDVSKVSNVKGLAFVCHPQPILGGSAQHSVPHYLAKSLVESSWRVFRSSFRGVAT